MNNKKTIIAICILGILIAVFLLLNTYAYWKIDKKDNASNKAASACLSINYKSLSPDIKILNAWPLSDDEGVKTTAYEFSVENTCDEDVNYEIVIESVATTLKNYMGYENIKVQLDNGAIKKLIDLTPVTKDPDANYQIRDTGHLSSRKVEGHRTNYHKLRLWLASDASLDAREKEFSGKIKVYAGQQITAPEFALTDEDCFIFEPETGTVTGFKTSVCPNTFALPATIGGVVVKHIDLTKNDFDMRLHRWGLIDLSRATGLESIGDYSFWSTYNIRNEIVIPDSVKTIGQRAFGRYRGSKVVLGKNVETIGEEAFNEYVGTNQELVIPSSVKTIDKYAFTSFKGSNLVFNQGGNLKSIGDYAFASYPGSSNSILTIPNSVEYVGNTAFGEYRGMRLDLGDGPTTIGAYAFKSYAGLNAGYPLTIPGNVKNVEAGAFSSYNGSFGLFIASGVEKIGSSAFYSYTGQGFNNLTIPGSVKTIDNWAFRNYTGQNLIIENGVETIGTAAFYSFDRTVSIPASVNNIGNSAFNSIPRGRFVYLARYNVSGMNLEPGWHGQAEVKCRVGEVWGNWGTCPDLNN